jgi:bacterioferritin-associated ferredoxin
MSDTRPQAAPWSTIDRLRQWWRGWREAKSGLSDLNQFGDYEVERTARELGTSVSELRELAARGSASANLLLGRMAALDLDPKEVAATDLATFRDLQRVCTMCGSHRRCARELARDPGDTAWEDYCPNAATLKALDALPWKARGEW